MKSKFLLMFSYLDSLFEKSKLGTVFIFFLLIKILTTVLLSIFVSFFDKELITSPVSNLPVFESLLVSVVVAPVFESLFFQYVVFKLGMLLRIDDSTLVLISSLLFSLAHHYNIAYMVVTLFSGFIYAIAFCYIKNQRDYLTAFLFVTGIHSLNNLLGWAVNDAWKTAL